MGNNLLMRLCSELESWDVEKITLNLATSSRALARELTVCS
jgi:hypothetical protein